MKKKITMILAVFILMTTHVYALEQAEARKIKESVKSNQSVIIDIREKDEIESGKLEIAKWFAMSKIYEDEKWLNSFTKLTKDKKVYLYCRSGSRAATVKRILKKNGIDAVNIGGYSSLENLFKTNSK